MKIEDIPLNFLINLVAGVVGILIVLWIERQRRPRISMKVGERTSLPDDDPLGRACTWAHIAICNGKTPRWLSWVYDGDPALACRAWISFHHAIDGHRLYSNEMVARWSEAPQPRVVTVPTEKGTAALLENTYDTVDIPTGECANIAPVCRPIGGDECYGWNNRSYVHSFKDPDWKLDKGRYIARIRVKTAGREFVDAFLIINDISYKEFRVEPIDEDIKRRLK